MIDRPRGGSRRRAALLVLAALSGAALHPATAAEAVAPGSVAFDYRNRPDLEHLSGFETVVLSPRAPEAAAAVHEQGAVVLVWLQPFLCSWRGQPPAPGTLLGDAYALAEAHGAWLREADGTPATVRDADVSDCRVYDFGNAAFVESLAVLVTARLEHADGVLLDYGCPSLGWEPSLAAVDAALWEGWSAGHLQYMDALRRHRPEWRLLCQCQRWGEQLPLACDGLVLEKVGWSLNPFRQVLEQAAAQPSKRSVLMIADALGHEDPVRRRVAAALALLLDYDFSYRVEDAFGPHASRDPEHFELTLGDWSGPRREVRTGVFVREAAFGFTVVNLSAEPYQRGAETIPPGDALTAQTHDPETGAAIPWRRAGAP